jgi:D-ribose pyranase
MKKQGILHPELSEVIASLGHTDTLVVADAGLPVPPGVRRIDLAVAGGVPPFMDVLKAILGDMQVEKAIIASEMESRSKTLRADLLSALGETPVEEVSHEELKQLTRGARAVVRTGEFTPYANVILSSGVVF